MKSRLLSILDCWDVDKPKLFINRKAPISVEFPFSKSYFTQKHTHTIRIIYLLSFRVSRVPAEKLEAPVLTGSYSDVFAFNVTCLSIGKTTFSFTVGNTASSTNQ